ncbi:MAG: polymorphic toxin-type HINT domain-containing protein [Candidatus Bathyarchaeia archaeon]
MVTLGLAASMAAFSGCLTTTSSLPKPDPTQNRLSNVNSELGKIEKEIAQLEDIKSATEQQLKESRIELMNIMAELSGTPRITPKLEEDNPLEDKRMMIEMHQKNIEVCESELKKIEAKISALQAKASELKAERKQLEREQVSQTTQNPALAPGAAEATSCFTPDTLVTVPGGRKSIVTLKADDELIAYNEATGELVYRKIINTYNGVEDHYFIINGEIRVTSTHRFFTDRGWIRAKDLEPGMLLKTSNGWVPLESKELVEARVEVFNLEVAADHDFFVVGESHSYLVHNCGGGGK